MFNQVEVAIWAYDFCLSCVIYVIGDMLFWIELFSYDGQLMG